MTASTEELIPGSTIPEAGGDDLFQAPDTPVKPEYEVTPSEGSEAITDPLFTKDSAESVMENVQPFVDKMPEVKEEETVSGQLDKILNQPSRLWDYAKGIGAQYANSRGLQNSDIGAQAGAQALFEQAVPIATSDANTYARRSDIVANTWGQAGLQIGQGTIDSMLSVQDHAEKMVELAKQGDINSKLQLEQFGYNFDLSVQDNIEALIQMAAQGDIDSKHLLEQFGYDSDLMDKDQGFKLDLMNKDLSNALAIDNNNHDNWLEQNNQQHINTLEEIAAQGDENQEIHGTDFTIGLQQGYLAYADVRGREYSREVQEIYTTEGLTPAQQAHAADTALARYEDDMAMMQSFYTSNPYWDDAWELPLGAGGATGSGTGTDDPNPDTIPSSGGNDYNPDDSYTDPKGINANDPVDEEGG